MKTLTSTEIRSTLTSQGYIELSILTVDKPTPAEDEVLIRVEAAPINPSDLGLLLTFGADLDNINVSGSGDKTVTKIKVNDRLIKVMEQRLDQSLQVGNEGPTFRYIKEIVNGNSALLEFETEVDGIYINGVDLISWDEKGKITEFKVIVRPLQAVTALHRIMQAVLKEMK